MDVVAAKKGGEFGFNLWPLIEYHHHYNQSYLGKEGKMTRQ
jgi:hypothetical protein